jgi:hypothetical protein
LRPLPLDATNFENDYPTTKELVCSEFDEDRVRKVKFTLEQAMKAQRGSRGIDLLFP